jgi:hypothetical protein
MKQRKLVQLPLNHQRQVMRGSDNCTKKKTRKCYEILTFPSKWKTNEQMNELPSSSSGSSSEQSSEREHTPNTCMQWSNTLSVQLAATLFSTRDIKQLMNNAYDTEQTADRHFIYNF